VVQVLKEMMISITTTLDLALEKQEIQVALELVVVVVEEESLITLEEEEEVVVMMMVVMEEEEEVKAQEETLARVEILVALVIVHQVAWLPRALGTTT
jgi:hypothetical protein